MITNSYINRQRKIIASENRQLKSIIKPLKTDETYSDEGVVICHIKDGISYIDHFLNHYRAIGVKKFAIIDNGSKDGGKEYLLTQKDCDVYECHDDYKRSRCGTFWKNTLIEHYQNAKWIFSCDIDELAVYDGWPELDLNKLAETCSKAGYGAVTAVMIDMYDLGPLSKAIGPHESINLLKDFSHFDGTGYSRIKEHNWRKNNFPRQIIDGGPSKRVAGGSRFAWLAKTPLILEPGVFFLDPHTVIPVSLNFNKVLIGLLHFRFNGDLLKKTKIAKKLGHTQGSVEKYNKYGSQIESNPDFSFGYDNSQKFEKPSQFIEKGIIESLVKK